MASVPKKANKFPLFKHPRGYWAKTVLKKHHYFGKIADDPQGKEALKRWLFKKDYLLAGLEPPAYDPNGGDEQTINVKYLCNRYLATKEAELKAGEIVKRTFDSWKTVCVMVMDSIPGSLPLDKISPDHFEKVLLAIKTRYSSPNSRGQYTMAVRSLFKYGHDMGMLQRQMVYCPGFVKPPAMAYRKHEAATGDRSLTREEVVSLLKGADTAMRVCVLLGLQCGFSNVECALLERSSIKDGWVVMPRIKTSVPRRIPLWPETINAIKTSIAEGPTDGKFVIYRKSGMPFKSNRHVGYAFETLAAAVKVEARFYDLRRTLQTACENNLDNFDLPAIQAVMGHAVRQDDMSARYRQNISDDRLLAVTNAVRKWLGKIPKGGAK
jgi:integrase